MSSPKAASSPTLPRSNSIRRHHHNDSQSTTDSSSSSSSIPTLPPADESTIPCLVELQKAVTAGHLPQSQYDELRLLYLNLYGHVVSSLESERALLSQVQSSQSLLDESKSLVGRLGDDIHKMEKDNGDRQLKEKTKKGNIMKLHEEKSRLLGEVEDIQRIHREVKEVTAKKRREVDELKEAERMAVDITQKVRTHPLSQSELEGEGSSSSSTTSPAPLPSVLTYILTLPSLHSQLTNLSEDILRQHEFISSEEKSLLEYDTKILELQMYIDQLEKEKTKKEAQFSMVESEPDRVETNMKMIEGVVREIADENDALHNDLMDRERRLADLHDERRRMQEDIEQAGIQLENIRLSIAKKKAEMDDITRQKEIEEQKHDTLVEKKASSEAYRVELKDQSKSSLTLLHSYSKAYEGLKKTYEKSRRRVETIKSIKKPLMDQLFEIKMKMSTVSGEVKKSELDLVEIKSDAEMMIAMILQDEEKDDAQKEKKREFDGEIREMECSLGALKEEEKMFHLSHQSKMSSRELMSRDLSKLLLQVKLHKENNKMKNLVIIDLQKQVEESSAKLNGCNKKYEKMKNQRNKLANLSQGIQQSIGEMKEKIKIMSNEYDILKVEFLSKDRSLNEEVKLHQQFQHQRDTLRVECNKLIHEAKQLNNSYNNSLLYNIELNHSAVSIDKKLLQIRSDIAALIEKRNAIMMKNVDKNDELLLMKERRKVIEGMLKECGENIKRTEEDVKGCEMELNEMRRRIEVERREIPSLDLYNDKRRKMMRIDEEIAGEEDEVEKLERELETPNMAAIDAEYEKISGGANDGGGKGKKSLLLSVSSPSASLARPLGGMDPSAEELAGKIEVLTEKLNSQKEKMKAKDAELMDISMVKSKMDNEIDEVKPAYVEYQRQRNFVEAEIRTANRSLQALISELSMYQARVMKLEEEVSTKGLEMEEARRRVERGLQPTGDAEFEWVKMERERQRLQENAMLGLKRKESERMEGQMKQLSMVKSSAISRADSYLSMELGIPLPKPFSSTLPPFKSTMNGTGNMRHYRG